LIYDSPAPGPKIADRGTCSLALENLPPPPRKRGGEVVLQLPRNSELLRLAQHRRDIVMPGHEIDHRAVT
jgi:hypothetical protein